MEHLLLVCTANICRSAYAEVRAKALVGRRSALRIGSAGTHGWDRSEMDPPMAAAAARRGTPADRFRSRPLTAELLRGAELVLTMTDAHRAWILDDHPWVHLRLLTLGQLASAAARLPNDVEGSELISAARAITTHPALDVADPYRRGPIAAEQCANQIDAMLHAVLPRL